MNKQEIILCRISKQPISKPVVIDHPRISQFYYDEQSVIALTADGKLAEFGITSENLKAFLFVDQFTLSIIERLSDGRTLLDLRHLLAVKKTSPSVDELAANMGEEDLSDLGCPITQEFILGEAALCTRDGRTYDYNSFCDSIQYTRTSTFSKRTININTDLILHPIHHLIMTELYRHPKKIIDLELLLCDFCQPNPQYVRVREPIQDRIVRLTMLSICQLVGALHLGVSLNNWVDRVGTITSLQSMTRISIFSISVSAEFV